MSPLALLSALGRTARTAPHPTPLEAEPSLTPRLRQLLGADLRLAARIAPRYLVACMDCDTRFSLSANVCPGCGSSAYVALPVRRCPALIQQLRRAS